MERKAMLCQLLKMKMRRSDCATEWRMAMNANFERGYHFMSGAILALSQLVGSVLI